MKTVLVRALCDLPFHRFRSDANFLSLVDGADWNIIAIASLVSIVPIVLKRKSKRISVELLVCILKQTWTNGLVVSAKHMSHELCKPNTKHVVAHAGNLVQLQYA